MNCKKYLTNNYIPTRPKLLNDHERFDLDARLQQMTINEIMQNPDSHFENAYITNFDLMHHQCSGDKLTHDKECYETLFNERLNSQIINVNEKATLFRQHLIANEKMLTLKIRYMKIISIKNFSEKLNRDGVFLSNMRKQKKYSNDCKSLSF